MELIRIEIIPSPGFATVVKGAGHRYVKREPTGKPKPKYRYFYKEPKGGIVSSDGAKVGAKFRHGKEGEHGHYEVTDKHDDGTVTVKHDETGHETRISHDELRDMIHGGDHHIGTDAHREQTARKKKGETEKTPREQAEAHSQRMTDAWEEASRFMTEGVTEEEMGQRINTFSDTLESLVALKANEPENEEDLPEHYKKMADLVEAGLKTLKEKHGGESETSEPEAPEKPDWDDGSADADGESGPWERDGDAPGGDAADADGETGAFDRDWDNILEGWPDDDAEEKPDAPADGPGKWNENSDPDEVAAHISELGGELDSLEQGDTYKAAKYLRERIADEGDKLDGKLEAALKDSGIAASDVTKENMPPAAKKLLADYANTAHAFISHLKDHGTVPHPGRAKEGMSDEEAGKHMEGLLMHYTGSDDIVDALGTDKGDHWSAHVNATTELATNPNVNKMGIHDVLNHFDDAHKKVKEKAKKGMGFTTMVKGKKDKKTADLMPSFEDMSKPARKGKGSTFLTRCGDPGGGEQAEDKPWPDPPGSGPGAIVSSESEVSKAISLGQQREEGWNGDMIRAGKAGSPQGAAPNLSRIPINQRPAARTTAWPVENRPMKSFLPSDSRNYGNGLFRRYPNGELDYGWAKSVVEESIRKSKIGLPLTENEALALSTLFPNFAFKGLPSGIVDIKARLSAAEKDKLRQTISHGALVVLSSMSGGSSF